jgi:hypothetical protein
VLFSHSVMSILSPKLPGPFFGSITANHKIGQSSFRHPRPLN